MKRHGPSRHVPADRLFRLLLRSPRASLPIALPIAGAPAGRYCARALHPLDEVEAIERRADAPEPLRPTLVAAELTALALHDADARVFADGAELLRLFTERDAIALMRCDADLVTHALENLLRNAREAAPDGAVRVSTETDGQHVHIRVSDDGPGMDARAREQALEEFFTTKVSGSGLGLPYAARVAEAHGGVLRIDSQPGRGTTVEIALPIGGVRR